MICKDLKLSDKVNGGLTLLSEKEPLPRMALGITVVTRSSSSLSLVVMLSMVIAETTFPFVEGADLFSLLGAFPHASQVAVIFLYNFPSGKPCRQLCEL